MKIYITLFALFCLGTFSLGAQNTEGTDFWLTFGENNLHTINASADQYLELLDLELRFVSGKMPANVVIYFTNLNTSVTLSIASRSVVTYNLPSFEIKQAVYNKLDGISNYSIHITSDQPVSAYALNSTNRSTDATILLPVEALGTEYHHISYIPRNFTNANDAYAVIATEDDTYIFHDNSTTPIVTLHTGQVYYHTSPSDMTGAYITATKPVAFFVLTQGVVVPYDADTGDCFMQQLAPVYTWGYSFFAPVSDLTGIWTSDTKDRVRIVASQDNTTITQIGGTLITNSGGQTDYTINKGQFIELEIYLNNNGCYITADKPIGVCTYLTTGQYNNDPPNPPFQVSDPSMAWLPSMEQKVAEAMIAPFVPPPSSEINEHFAIIVTSTNTKNNTTVSIGSGNPENLSGGVWRDHNEAGISFYNMPLTISDASYLFANEKGLVILGYGTGYAESYYYLAYSAMRDLSKCDNLNLSTTGVSSDGFIQLEWQWQSPPAETYNFTIFQRDDEVDWQPASIQFTTDTTANVNSAPDLAAPETPVANYHADNCKLIDIISKDNGTPYRFYIKAINMINNADTCSSDILDVVNKTGLKGFYILEDNNPTSNPDISSSLFIAAEDNQLITYSVQNHSPYTHIQAIDSAGNFSAVFTLKQPSIYIITATTSTILGSITPNGKVIVSCGENKTFTFTPPTCYEIDEVLVDGVNNPEAVAAGSYTFENVMENHTIVVSFKW
jgi:hypothetical protein